LPTAAAGQIFVVVILKSDSGVEEIDFKIFLPALNIDSHYGHQKLLAN
jgi:hypothetical protein